jgi:hypothetical protein
LRSEGVRTYSTAREGEEVVATKSQGRSQASTKYRILKLTFFSLHRFVSYNPLFPTVPLIEIAYLMDKSDYFVKR